MEHFIDELIRLISAVAATGAVIMGFVNRRKINEIHISINSRMDELIHQTGLASEAKGAAQQRQDTAHEKALADDRPDNGFKDGLMK